MVLSPRVWAEWNLHLLGPVKCWTALCWAWQLRSVRGWGMGKPWPCDSVSVVMGWVNSLFWWTFDGENMAMPCYGYGDTIFFSIHP